MKIPTQEQLDYIKNHYQYDPATGHIIKKAEYYSIGLLKNEARIVGAKSKGYIMITMQPIKKSVYAHHVAWYLHYGEWPADQLDHIDRNKSNNLIDNLRIATGANNQYNRTKSANTSSQYKGVSYNKQTKKWTASIRKDYERYFIGYFTTEIEAAQAYDAKAKELFGEFACPNLPE